MIHGKGNKGNLNLLYKFVQSGLPYPLGSYQNRRSFLNVDNFNFIIDHFIHGDARSGIYHLADEGFLSTSDLVRLIGKALNKRPRIWNVPATLVELGFTTLGKKRMLEKLTEDMLVSNQKLLNELKTPLPVSIEQGIINTIRSFDESR
jgi:nucleoside-diphosphate-sugar epimerase